MSLRDNLMAIASSGELSHYDVRQLDAQISKREVA